MMTIISVCFGAAGPAVAGAAFRCGSFALLGGAQLLCSHIDPEAPPQICTFSWTLAGPDGSSSVVQGSFVLAPGVSNATIYQGSGYAYALSNPVILCQGRKTGL